jgi:putative ABC transport system permease protein
VDGRVVAAAVALTIVTGLAIGLLPAIRGTRANIDTTLRATSSAVRSSYGRAPATLVVLEVAFSLVLLVGTALMARTLVNLAAIDPGFEPEGLVAMHVDLPSDRYPAGTRGAFFDAVFERLRRVPGVTGAAIAMGLPPGQGGFSWGTLEAEGGVRLPDVRVPRNNVSPQYFPTLRIPIVAGRNFTADDTSDRVIISRGLADRLWPGGSAIGKRFRFVDSEWQTVVGVAANVETRGARDARTDFQLYNAWISRPPAPSTAPAVPRRRTFDWRLLIVRADNPSAAIPEIKRAIWAVDPKQPVERIALVSDLYGDAFGRQRFVLMLMSAFSIVALGLTAAGIFGVLSQIVMRRTREIGIRMVLGARPSDVMRQVLRNGLALSLLGAAIGIAAALTLSRVLRTLLFGVTPWDPVSFAVVAVFLVAVAVAACWLPARSAMRIEPAAALRVE